MNQDLERTLDRVGVDRRMAGQACAWLATELDELSAAVERMRTTVQNSLPKDEQRILNLIIERIQDAASPCRAFHTQTRRTRK